MAEWYTIDNIDQIDTPALAVYPGRIRQNIERMLEMVDGDPERLRPHVKTHKMAEVVQLQLDRGIRKFKCATIAEAEMLGSTGAPDVLLAYQPVGPKVHRLLELTKLFPATNFSALVDNRDSAAFMSGVFAGEGKVLPVFIDLDIGHHRTGIPADDRAWDLALFCESLPGLHLAGLHAYDGHMGITDLAERTRQCEEGFAPVPELAQRIRTHTGRTPVIVAGGSPSFPIHARREGVECSPGTCLLWDWGYQKKLPDQPFLLAALVLSRVISRIGSNRVCVDLGHKSVAAEQPFPRVLFLNLPEATQVLQSEEHLVLEVADNADLPVGTVLYGVPQHICPTCALHDRVQVVENGRVTTTWQVISRDRVITV